MSRLFLLASLVLITSFAFAERIYVQNGTAMVPLRYVADWLGATIKADAKTKATTFTWNGKSAVIKPNNATVTVAGKAVKLPAAPAEGRGVLYVPARLFTSFGLALTTVPEDVPWINEIVLTNAKAGKSLHLPVTDRDETTTPLHLDAYNGLTSLVATHIARGLNVDAKDSRRHTALHVAASRGNLEMVKLLLAKGAAINGNNGFGQPLLAALHDGHQVIAMYLLQQGATMDTMALDVAARQGAKDIVVYMLAKGVAIESENEYSPVPLVGAAEAGQLEIVDLLLAKGANVNRGDVFGNTPLFAAAEKGHLTVVKRLLEKGAKINEINDVWRTGSSQWGEYLGVKMDLSEFAPIHIAARAGQADIVSALLGAGAEVDLKSGENLTALHCAALASENNPDEVVELLLEKKANVNAVASGFSIEISGGPMEDVSMRDFTPLHLALLSGEEQRRKVKALLAAGADVNAKTKNGYTPLHFAVLTGVQSELLCTQLLEAKADLTAKAEDGMTPLKLATACKNEKVAKLLKEYGAKE